MKSPAPIGIAILTVATALSACGGDDLGTYNQLDRLRVLAVRADPPDIGPGQSTTLTPLVYAPNGEVPTYTWSWCPYTLPRESGFACAVTQQQLQQTADDAVGAGVITVAPFELGSGQTATLPYLADPAVLRAFCSELAGRATATSALPVCEDAFEITVRLQVRTANAEVDAIKRVRLAFDASGATNTNPVLGTLHAATGEDASEQDATALPSNGSGSLAANASHRLWVDVPESSLESFVPDPDPATPDEVPSPVRETHYLTWFVTAGETDTQRTAFIDGEVSLDVLRENVWTLPAGAEVPAGRASLWLVLRDERGGVSWSQYDVATPER